MGIDIKNRLGRISAAIAVGLVAVMGVASTADAQTWNSYNGGYYYPPLTNAPYNGPYSNRGWTWGERYGAPPTGYYANRGYYAAPPSYSYGSNPQAAFGQVMRLFAR
jgi:hypothetical protein